MSNRVSPLSKIISLIPFLERRRHPQWCQQHWGTDRHFSDYTIGESSDTNLSGHPATTWSLRAMSSRSAAARVSGALHLSGWLDAAPRQTMLLDLPAADARALAYDLLRVASLIEVGR